jgi:hypothetical protein
MPETSRSRIIAEVDFGKNGRQHGYLRLFHSVHSSAYGFIPIPIVVLTAPPRCSFQAHMATSTRARSRYATWRSRWTPRTFGAAS